MVKLGRRLLLGGFLGQLIMLAGAAPAWSEIVNVTLLHLNDVYEITPVQGGQRGGLARVATLRQQLKQENPRTYTILAGDLVSPSALGTAKVNGERLAGRQIIAAMNVMGLDFATFGNHEFDLSESELLKRLQESKFKWFSGNVSDRNGTPFPGVLPHVMLQVPGKTATVKVALIGLTLPSNQKDYVRYQDVLEVARRQVTQLRNQADVIVAVTHLSIEQDRQLAAALPEIDLIMGGHEHENIQQWRFVNRSSQPGCARNTTPIFKADANAITVYVHRLSYDTTRRCLTLRSELQEVTAALPEEPKTAQVVQSWLQRGFQGFRSEGFEPTQTVAAIAEPLDGLESSVRNQPTNLTQLIAQSMVHTAKDVDLALFNSGAIRIDDILPPGPVTQYDIIRILPFGGDVLTVTIRGDILQRALAVGQTNQGSGGYLQMANVQRTATGAWLVQGQAINPQQTYRVAVNDFLVSGQEQNLGFLKLGEPGIELVTRHTDVRVALIQFLKTRSSSR